MNRFISFLIVTLLISNAISAQEKWKCEMYLGDHEFGPIKTFMYAQYNSSDSLVQLHTAPNADRRIFGSFMSTFIRLLNKMPKKGILLTINDIKYTHHSHNGDSLHGKFLMPMLGLNQISGIQRNDSLFIRFFSKAYNAQVHLTAWKTTPDDRLEYQNLPERIFDTTQKYLFNPEYLNTRKWKKFERYLNRLASKAEDDLDLYLGFGIKSQKLPFSHYYLWFASPSGLTRDEDDTGEYKTHNNVFFEEVSPEIALLTVKSFGGGAFEMDSVMNNVRKKQYKNLIIDLRNNGGGGLTSAYVLGSYLIDREISIGYFVTNKWYQQMGLDSRAFEKLPVSEAKTTDDLLAELMKSKGCNSLIKPQKDNFKGNIFLLTNGNTGSTCEPMVAGLKTRDKVTIVGETTAGAMLSAAHIQVMDRIYLFMAIADYYTPDKKRLDQVGVEPDIKVASDQALDYVLKLINESDNNN
jgi:hypothetical protein